jgi:hypothetical protein
MKLSLTLNRGRTLNRSEAWACFSANLALPGAGSLAAGRAVGYAQLALGFAGLLLSVIAGVGTVSWGLASWGRITQPSDADPLAGILELWQHGKWTLTGLAIFAIAISWAAATGLQIVAKAPKEAVPPKIA